MENSVLGKRAIDNVTGFTGTVTARAEYLGGTPRVQIEPRVSEDGKAEDARWVDEERISIVAEE